jgi:hypothetical protein
MKKNILAAIVIANILPSLFLFSIFTAPQYSFAQEPGARGYSFWPENYQCKGDPLKGTNESECTYQDLMYFVNRGVNFLFYLAVIFATFAFVIAGFKLLTAGGNTSKAEDAKKIFGSVVKGFIWILIAWLLVTFIINIFELKDDYTILDK